MRADVDFGWSPRQQALADRMRRVGEGLGGPDDLGDFGDLGDPSDLGDPGATDDSGTSGDHDPAEALALFRRRWNRLAEAGVLGLPVPAADGGSGHDPLTCALALESLGRGCPDLGLLISAGAHIWAVELPLMHYGSPGQRERYLPGLASGALIGAHAITEPGAGSDAMALATIAEPKDGGYVLSGSKRFVTNGPVADLFLVYATLDPRLGFTGVTAFLLDRDTPGLRIESDVAKSGLRSSPWARLTLDRCPVGPENLLGAPKQGSKIFATVMTWERALLLTPLLGAMARSIDACLEHAGTRRQFGARIGSFQSVANRIVDMRIRLETARLAAYRAAWDLGAGRATIFSELAKLQVSEAAVSVFQDAMVLFGGAGYTAGAEPERALRDALGTTLSSGTSDLQRVVIAGKLGLR